MNTALISLTIMGGFYIFTGISHFRNPKLFLKITPKWVPYPEKINVFVGIVEILLGVALFFSLTRNLAIWGIIALLIAVFPANIYHFQQARKKGKMVIPTLIRLPIQLALIYWAFSLL
jgi:uncharacterized membrane protein